MNELARSPRCVRYGSSPTQTRNAEKSGQRLATRWFFDHHASRYRPLAFDVNAVLC